MNHSKQIIYSGKTAPEASKVLIMTHGRGGSAEDILSLQSYFKLEDFMLVAPQATNNSWYPYSFMAPIKENEPWLSSALDLLAGIVKELEAQGFSKQSIYFMGFSQGACLALEFVTRNAAKYGGVVAFTGGLIGDKIYKENYNGDFAGTPIFIGTSDVDPHVPLDRVNQTVLLLNDLHAKVTAKIYPGMGHTIVEDEINQVRKIVFGE